MTPLKSDPSDGRVLVEILLSDGSGAIVADGRFVLEIKDGVGRLVEPLRCMANPYQHYRLDLRISELLGRSEREELERLRKLARTVGGEQ